MKRIKFILNICLTAFYFTILLTSCKKEEQDAKQNTAYKATEHILTETAASAKATFGNSTVYYVSIDNTDENSTEKLYRYDMKSKTETELQISREEGEQILQIHSTIHNGLAILTVLENKALFYLSLYDKDGKKLWKNEVTASLKDKDLETNFYMASDREGNLYLLNGFYHVCVWDSQGNFGFSLRSDLIMNGISMIDGKIYTYGSRQNQRTLQELDAGKQKWKEVKCKELPSVSGFNGCILGEDTENGILVNTGANLSSYNPEKGTSNILLTWTNYGITPETILAWQKNEEDIFCITTKNNKLKLITFSPSEDGEDVEKQIVTIGSVGTHGYIENAISEFNQKNNTYTIQLVEYEGNLDNSISQQDLEITAGKGPDIVCMLAEEYKKYADKGILEDLYPYLDRDQETGKEDYLPNILTAHERNGKLCGIPSGFYIDTIIMPTKYAGTKMGVTVEEFIDIVNNLPENKKLLPFFTDKKMIFSILIPHSYQQFINFDNYTCNFEGEEFIAWLNFMNSIPLEEARSDYSGIALKNYVLGIGSIMDFTTYQYEKARFKEEELTFLGYPGQSDCGSYIVADTIVGICSQSAKKEGAWEFIKFLLSEERQDTLLESEILRFPARISSLEKGIAKAMEPEYETDENGNQREIPKEERTLISNEKISLYAATEEDIKKMRELITSVNVLSNGGRTPIINIILEEVPAFYEGDKTAEEVAALIQNRVEIYLNETR